MAFLPPTEYNENAVTPTTPKGPTIMIERDDALSTPVAEGDWMALKGDANGAAYVTLATKLDSTNDSVEAVLSAVDNAVLDDIAAKLATIDADTSALFGTVGGTEVQVDIVAALPAGTQTIGKVDLNPLSTVVNGQTNVTTAGTQVALAGSTAIKSVTVKAKHANTGWIYVGDLNVDSTTGFVLDAGETISLDVDNLADVFIDSSVNAEGVSYLALQ